MPTQKKMSRLKKRKGLAWWCHAVWDCEGGVCCLGDVEKNHWDKNGKYQDYDCWEKRGDGLGAHPGFLQQEWVSTQSVQGSDLQGYEETESLDVDEMDEEGYLLAGWDKSIHTRCTVIETTGAEWATRHPRGGHSHTQPSRAQAKSQHPQQHLVGPLWLAPSCIVPHELISFQTDCDKEDDNFKLVYKTAVVTAEQMVLYGGNEVPDPISYLVSHAAFPVMCPTLHGLPHDT